MADNHSKTDYIELDPAVCWYFNEEFKKAITSDQRDAEGFQEILFAIEKLGITLSGKVVGLGEYKNYIEAFVEKAPLARSIKADLAHWHLPFSELHDLVRDARNDAFHSGSIARHITSNAIQLALILEDALMSNAKFVREFMVKSPVCAYTWQPVSLARQLMLANNFTFLPITDDTGPQSAWRLLADYNLVIYLRKAKNNKER
jgi:CBS domain-containing protein